MNIRKKTFTYDEIDLTLGEINREIEKYRRTYYCKPQFIIISKELEILFGTRTEITYQREKILINDEVIEIFRLFGNSCIISPALHDLQFAIV